MRLMFSTVFGHWSRTAWVFLQEAAILCERVREESNGGRAALKVNYYFMTAINNVVWSITTGKRSK